MYCLVDISKKTVKRLTIQLLQVSNHFIIVIY